MINFKANYLSTAQVQRRMQDNKFQDYKVSFVEFKPIDRKDVCAIKDISRQWEDGETFAKSIFNDIQEDYYVGSYTSPRGQYFGITRQKTNFQTPLPDEILALAELRKISDTRNELVYLQVDPEQNMFARDALFKGIGTAVLDSIKTLFKGKEIILQPVESAINFYKANKFLNLEFSSKLIWRP